ncbi:uncharacterized protein F5891DRAFT_719596 [Suillus fuscotomentosus]|uniref:Secreted protein n=1 Tax=Suillus fuscotomentosus TaxID=1912939 RepID=A0AAD4EF10_9AGAM|nr:uncharacterized protein F5891DRAFT_719596 [Suillus fuscotomentosus]KAG1904927.1 hypothetical protein F5891DRAFT_719596 [Suillus fuscotomentosus]
MVHGMQRPLFSFAIFRSFLISNVLGGSPDFNALCFQPIIVHHVTASATCNLPIGEWHPSRRMISRRSKPNRDNINNGRSDVQRARVVMTNSLPMYFERSAQSIRKD